MSLINDATVTTTATLRSTRVSIVFINNGTLSRHSYSCYHPIKEVSTNGWCQYDTGISVLTRT